MKEKGKGIDLRVFEFQGALQQTNNEYCTMFICFFTKHHQMCSAHFCVGQRWRRWECKHFRLHRLVLHNAERMPAFFPGDAESLAIHTNFSARCFS